MVIVRFATHPVAANAASDPTSLPAYRAVAEHLMATDKTPFLGPEWVVEDIAGGGIIDNSRATLQFLPGGQLAGSGSCNRLLGSYKAEGQQLRFENTATTMMACAPALMNQERKLLELLNKVTGWKLDNTGALVLTTADGKTILARH